MGGNIGDCVVFKCFIFFVSFFVVRKIYLCKCRKLYFIDIIINEYVL